MNFDAVKNSLISEAKAAGLAEYEIYFMESDGISAETLNGEVSSFTSELSGGIGFRCVVDGRMGIASTEFFDDEEMKALVQRAINNAKNIESDDKAVIYSGSDSYKTPCLPAFEKADAAILKKRALELLESTTSQSEFVAEGTQTGGVSSNVRIKLINSHGLELSAEVGASLLFVQAVIQKDGEAQYGVAVESGLLGEKIDGMPKKAIEDALKKVGAVEIPSGKYDIIIDGKQMKNLLATFSPVFSGRQANLGLSLLKGKENEQVASPCITIVDDPFYEGSAMQIGFDGEGVATYTKNVVENGVLKTLLYDIASADKVGKQSTGNGQRGSYASPVGISPYHFYVAAGERTDEELLADLKDGLYITDLKGLHAGANAVTGDFSIESFGFLVENGKKTKAVKSFTVAGNFFELLKSIEAVSNDVKFGLDNDFTVFGAPDTLIRNMSVAGT